MIGMSSPGNSYCRQQLPNLQLHQVQKLRIVHHVHLVQEHHDVRNSHLPRQQNVLPRLRHRAVRRRYHQDRSVHLRRSRDHVLHVIRVTRTVHVRVVTVRRRVLHVRRRNRDPTLPLLRRIVDRIEAPEMHALVTLRQYLRDRCRQRRLPVVHVTNRPHVQVGLASIEFLFRHDEFVLLCSLSYGSMVVSNQLNQRPVTLATTSSPTLFGASSYW